MPPSETFVALQRLAKRRREDPPGAPRGPGPAPASEPRGASSASQTFGFPTGTGDGGASLEDPADDAPRRPAAITAGALAHLPRFEDVVSRYWLFRGDDTDAETGCRCEPVMASEGSGAGEMTCLCRDCELWRRVTRGAPGDEEPFWVKRTKRNRNKTKTKTKPMYEVFTREHVAGLASYFRGRADALLGAEAKTRSLRVLELGAGSGVLSRSLAAATAALDEAELFGIARGSRASVTYHATDDYSFSFAKEGVSRDEEDDEEENEEENAFSVRALDYRAALRSLTACDGSPPDLVLICWHPIREDWTAEVRRVAAVLEYVLVGECDFGACGLPVETWGLRGDGCLSSDGDDGDDVSETGPFGNAFSPPPYLADGFERVDLAFLSKHQVCRTDEPWLKARRSKTVSFRRRREEES